MKLLINIIIIILVATLFSPVIGETVSAGNDGHVIVKPDVCSQDDGFQSQTLDVQCLLNLSLSTMIQYAKIDKSNDQSFYIPAEPDATKEKPPRHMHIVIL